MIEPGGYVVVAAEVSRFLALNPEITATVVGDWEGTLSNKGERIKLVNSNDTAIDTVSYHDEGVWAARLLGPLDHTHRGWAWHNGHDGEGESLELINPELSNEFGQNWDASLTGQGTPGTVNSVYNLDTAPIIKDVIHDPAVPNSSDPVTVSAEAIDTRGHSIALTLYWRIDRSNYEKDRCPSQALSTYQAVPMTDNGDGNLYRCTYDMRHGYRTVADLTFLGRNSAHYTENYTKKTNEELNDWSDLFDLTHRLNDANIPDNDFVRQVGKIVDLEQWTLFMAADTLVGIREKGLYSGLGDDFALFSGIEDRRFWLVPHDLDTVLGQGDEGYHREQDILSYEKVPGLYRLMNHPDIKAMYYDQLRELTDTVFTPEIMNPLIYNLLGNWVIDEAINGPEGMKQFVLDRLDSVITGSKPQVPQNQ